MQPFVRRRLHSPAHRLRCGNGRRIGRKSADVLHQRGQIGVPQQALLHSLALPQRNVGSQQDVVCASDGIARRCHQQLRRFVQPNIHRREYELAQRGEPLFRQHRADGGLNRLFHIVGERAARRLRRLKPRLQLRRPPLAPLRRHQPEPVAQSRRLYAHIEISAN